MTLTWLTDNVFEQSVMLLQLDGQTTMQLKGAKKTRPVVGDINVNRDWERVADAKQLATFLDQPISGSMYKNAYTDKVTSYISSFPAKMNTWRKIQSLGLVHLYRENDDIKRCCGMLDGFAILAIGDVVSRIQYLRENTPDELEPLIDYFDSTYISGQFRRILLPTQLDRTFPSIGMRRPPPTFAPELWNVHSITLWNNVFAKLIGHAHPTIWRAIDGVRKDQAMTSTLLLRDNRGDHTAKLYAVTLSNYNRSS
ncbi:hypothetical protein LSH36_1007g01010 [Paralvinella palmiformis]|uniref:Uncharacterized protein n=1 Tax=Paralvinella palmiformis TaxID=53620 RepID=A0AAD9IW64_9ANNE|nr:hypothetical protein LSH36_1007g01010 [Paralvinella palmiformis]